MRGVVRVEIVSPVTVAPAERLFQRLFDPSLSRFLKAMALLFLEAKIAISAGQPPG
jgi:hypothetical protein